jgi:predicted enzyme related to lactoylglutathione lyase
MEEKRPTTTHGKICYIEVPAIDVNRSADFYTAAFGWKTRKRGDGHLAFDDATGQVSGSWMLGRKAATEPGPLIYIMVDDIEAGVAAVIASGGKIMQPVGVDAPELTARFSDPAGNVLGLYQQPKQR